MSISRTVGALAVAACLILFASCAGRRGGSPADPVASDSTVPNRSQPEGRRSDPLTLPGQNRTLPSEDPRNQPGGEQTEVALPVVQRAAELPGAEAGEIVLPSSPGGQRETARYRVQVFATRLPESARRLRAELAGRFGEAVHLVEDGGITKVQVGDEKDRDAALSLLARLLGMGYQDAFIVEPNCR